MKVVHTLAYLHKDKGGPSVSVPSLLRGCVSQDVQVELVSQSWPGDDPADLLPREFPCRLAPTRDRSSFGWSGALPALLRERAAATDVVHSHGLWMHMDLAASRVAGRLRRPHLITPRGTLEPWALSHSAWKKRIARRVFQDRALRDAACIHALSVAEARNIRALGFRNPIAVIPNGMDLDPSLPPASPEPFLQRFPELRGRKLVLFLARLHSKKGTVHLVEAWRRLAAEFPEWQLVLAGPDEEGHRAVLEAATAAGGIGPRVTFTGLLTGELKRSGLAAADLYVLPSFSEGFSMATLEALAAGLPALLTPECNFPEAAAAGAAVEAAPNADATEAGLRALLERGDADRAEMGERGRRLVAGHYTWGSIAASMKEVYRWCLGGGELPPALAWEGRPV